MPPAGAEGRWRSPLVAAWEAFGRYDTYDGVEVFTLDLPPVGPAAHEPLLVLHGFPTCSFDFHLVVERLRSRRRVLMVDFLGYGLSAKPDRPYTMGLQADLTARFVASTGVTELSLLSHDMGDTVGGELLARQLEGTWPVEVVRRVVTNGSVYIEMAHLSPGQELLLSLPDERLGPEAPIDETTLTASLRATFSPTSTVDAEELAALWELVSHDDGHLLLARLIRYIEERRQHQSRFTGAIEEHPSPLAVVWGSEDPIAVRQMAERLHGVRPDAPLRLLDGVGHYPMVESPDAFVAAVLAGLDG
ncbi:MAG TPA: alpha/beta hydrolase [Acidimicrobiales bacterium]|nr:alpha/beta hydrolase [Acidimicrobiales bacterium]